MGVDAGNRDDDFAYFYLTSEYWLVKIKVDVGTNWRLKGKEKTKQRMVEESPINHVSFLDF